MLSENDHLGTKPPRRRSSSAHNLLILKVLGSARTRTAAACALPKRSPVKRQTLNVFAFIIFGTSVVPTGAQTDSAPGRQAVAPAPPTAASAGTVVTLPALVTELEQHNPELQAGRREIDVRLARVAPAGAPPDPTITAGFMSDLASVPFFPSGSAPNAFRQFSVSQEIPYPGKLGLRSQVAATEVTAERWNVEATRRRLIADLKSAYFDYAFADRAIAVVQRNKVLLDQVRQIAESQFSVGKGSQQDILKAQVEVSLLLERLTVLDQQRRTSQARINGLLYRDPETPLGPVAEYAPVTLPEDLEQLRSLERQQSPALKSQEQGITRGQQALALANRELRPDFGITVSTQKYGGGMPWMYGVDFMVKVPIYWERKQRPMVAEAAASLESARLMRNNTLATEQSQVTQEFLAATTSKRLADLYSDTILPQARLALESALASYQVGRVDFLTLLSNYQTVLTYEVSYEEQAARLRQALARMEPFVNQELVR
jgi:outer membrane protein, heavy metal efflux system